MPLWEQLRPNFENSELAKVFEKAPQQAPIPSLANLEVEEIIKHYPEEGPDTVLADGGLQRDQELKLDYAEKVKEDPHKARQWTPKVGVRGRG